MIAYDNASGENASTCGQRKAPRPECMNLGLLTKVERLGVETHQSNHLHSHKPN